MVVENIRDEYVYNIDIPLYSSLLGAKYTIDWKEIIEQMICDYYIDGINGGRKMKPLLRVKFGAKEWFIDERLEEFRNVNNPHDRLSFEEAFRRY